MSIFNFVFQVKTINNCPELHAKKVKLSDGDQAHRESDENLGENSDDGFSQISNFFFELKRILVNPSGRKSWELQVSLPQSGPLTIVVPIGTSISNILSEITSRSSYPLWISNADLLWQYVIQTLGERQLDEIPISSEYEAYPSTQREIADQFINYLKRVLDTDTSGITIYDQGHFLIHRRTLTVERKVHTNSNLIFICRDKILVNTHILECSPFSLLRVDQHRVSRALKKFQYILPPPIGSLAEYQVVTKNSIGSVDNLRNVKRRTTHQHFWEILPELVGIEAFSSPGSEEQRAS